MAKVLFTASTFSHIKNFHMPYLKCFQECGWTVHVACGGAAEQMPWTDRVIPLPFEKRMWAPGNFRAAGILRREIAAEGYDLICTHTSLAAFFTRLALPGKNRPKVINVAHGYLFDDDTPALRRWVLLTAERCMASRTDLVLTMNRWDFDLARRCKLGREVVNIPGMGVDFSRLEESGPDTARQVRERLGIPAGAFVLAYGAEFSKRKSQAVLLEALKLLPERAVLVLAGEGALLDTCRALAAKLGLEARVRFTGQVDSMAPLYAAADAVVASSRSEGLPFNIMEAMHYGLPVVASAVKGHVDLIRSDETGLLYTYGDAAACAEQVHILMDSQALCDRLGQQARQSVETYALERVLPVVMEQYMSRLPVAVG